ncbi:hypothetical protein Tco_0046654 [Tanacetum coccineum]
MSFLTMLDEITLESLSEEQFECFIEYYRENYSEDYKSDLENLKEVYKMMNGGVEYPRTQNASPSEIKEPYEPSPRMYSYEQPSCLRSTFVELPKSQPKRTYNEDLECEIFMVKMPKCMAWLDDKPIGNNYWELAYKDFLKGKRKNKFFTTLALGWLLEEIHVTWAHLEKKRTRLRLYTKSLKKLCIQSVETASRVLSDDVKTFEVTASEIW